jgi:hypothetical protein
MATSSQQQHRPTTTIVAAPVAAAAASSSLSTASSSAAALSSSSRCYLTPLLLTLRTDNNNVVTGGQHGATAADVSCHIPLDSVTLIGLNDTIVECMAATTENAHWALDTYRRFLQEFGVKVLKVDNLLYQNILEKKKLQNAKISYYSQFNISELQDVITKFKEIGKESTGATVVRNKSSSSSL